MIEWGKYKGGGKMQFLHEPFLLKIALVYLLVVSLLGFFAMGLDKWKAKKDRWRIPEHTLFLFALLGGSPGTILGMHLFRHKTQHWYFRLGMPLILVLQLALVVAGVWFGVL